MGRHDEAVHRATPILMYHSVADRSSEPFRRFCVPPGLFKEHLAALVESGHRTLTVTDLVDRREAGEPLPANAAVVTFDDGFADFHDHALPALVEAGTTATLYAVSGSIGATSSWLRDHGEGDRPVVSPSQLAACADAGIEIGAHGVTHRALDWLPPAEARAEIETSRRALQDLIGRPVHSFAYPFGYHRAAVRDLVRRAGYRSACAVQYRLSEHGEDPFRLSRLIVRGDCRAEELPRLLEDRGMRWTQRRDRARTTTWRALRTLRARALP